MNTVPAVKRPKRLAWLLALCSAWVWACACAGPDADTTPPEPAALSLAELRARHALPASRFVDIDGVDVHYLDEGDGPPVVLLHASFLNLRAWDPLAAALKSRYRVIRFDTLMSGLTSPAPPGLESIDTNVRLLEGLADHLGLQRFALVGTSSGGIVAFRFAAAAPERVSRLVLINSAGMPRTAATNPNRARAELAKYRGMNVKPRAYWATGMGSNFTAPHTVPEWLLDQVYDMHRREGLAAEAARFMARFDSSDARQVLGRISAPTLIQWGLENRTVMHLEADVFQHWLTGAPSLLRKYPGLGHYAYLEAPATILADLEAFLDGRLDPDLRQTTMQVPGERCP